MIDSNDITQVLTDEQEQLVQVMQSHATLQHHFEQLTKHVEQCYVRIQKLEALVLG